MNHMSFSIIPNMWQLFCISAVFFECVVWRMMNCQWFFFSRYFLANSHGSMRLKRNHSNVQNNRSNIQSTQSGIIHRDKPNDICCSCNLCWMNSICAKLSMRSSIAGCVKLVFHCRGIVNVKDYSSVYQNSHSKQSTVNNWIPICTPISFARIILMRKLIGNHSHNYYHQKFKIIANLQMLVIIVLNWTNLTRIALDSYLQHQNSALLWTHICTGFVRDGIGVDDKPSQSIAAYQSVWWTKISWTKNKHYQA